MGIYVWGTGCGASELIETGLDVNSISAFIDSLPMEDTFLGRPVLLPEKLDIADCELLIVSTRHSIEVAKRCRELEIPKEKIFFIKNHLELKDRNEICRTAEKLLGGDFLKRILPKNYLVRAQAPLCSTVLSHAELENDYIRLASLELICRRLGDVDGAAAELGVYKGQFAKSINRLLSERKLYLFDSFESFPEEAGASESFQAAHKNTAAEKVLSLMPYPEKVLLKRGYFPQSLDGLEECFCFVSLDVDFYQATLDGLRYFWKRLNPGGYIMLHDWGNPALPQVAEALRDYEAEIGKKLPAFPLCDIGCTLVLAKT